MPTIEGRQADIWINAYVNKAGDLAGVAKAIRSLVKKTLKGVEEYVNPWKIPSFDSNGPLCCFMAVPTRTEHRMPHPFANCAKG